MPEITLADIQKAAERIAGLVHRTPVLSSHRLNEAAGVDCVFKCENFQRGGAFKMRGAANFAAFADGSRTCARCCDILFGQSRPGRRHRCFRTQNARHHCDAGTHLNPNWTRRGLTAPGWSCMTGTLRIARRLDTASRQSQAPLFYLRMITPGPSRARGPRFWNCSMKDRAWMLSAFRSAAADCLPVHRSPPSQSIPRSRSSALSRRSPTIGLCRFARAGRSRSYRPKPLPMDSGLKAR